MTHRTEPEPSPVDEAFARFCARRDPDDLALVFDATAPRLLLAALHLSRDVAEAEDLVQTTFVEAIRSAARFDPTRPALPWLLAILARRAADRRRRARDSAGDPAELSGPDPAPDTALAQRETLERVAQALDDLPDPYHQVLVLRFAHGLTPIAIARALNRPAGTVHAQLHRGLALLRRVLPKGLASAVAVAVAGSERGLAAVRAEVLATAGAAQAGTTAALAKLALLVPLGAGLVAAAFWAATPATRRGTAPAPQRVALQASAGEARAAHERSAQDAPSPRSTVDAGTARTPDAEPAVMFAGRCVAAESGEPLAGVEIWFRLRWHDSMQAAAYGGHELLTEQAVTADDGAFAFRGPYRPRCSYTLFMRKAGRVTRAGWFADLVQPRAFELGDVPFLAGAATAGSVADENGQPIAGCSVGILAVPAELAGLPGADDEPQQVAIASGDGERLRSASTVPPGTWRLRVSGVAELLSPREITVAPGQQTLSLHLRAKRLPEPACITGIAVNAAGQPVAGVLVGAVGVDGGDVCRDTTDDAGRFALECYRPDAAELRITPLDPRRHELDAEAPLAPWGSSGVTVVVRPALEVPIVVTDGAGAPVVHFAVWIAPEVAHAKPALRHAGQHPGGRLVLSLPRGRTVLRIVPARRDLPIARRTVDLAIAPAEPLAFRLAPGRALRVRVRASDGAPVADSRVLLIENGDRRLCALDNGEPQLRDERAVFETCDGYVFAHRGDEPLLVWRSTTGADGEAVVHLADDLKAPALCVIGALHRVQYAHLDAAALAGGLVEVVVDAANHVRGVAGPDGIAATLELKVGLVRSRDDVLQPSSNESIWSPIAADGTFDLRAVPDGTWRVMLSGRWLLEAGVPDLVLSGGRVAELSLDLAPLRPGELAGAVTADGAVPPEGKVRLWRFDALRDRPVTADQWSNVSTAEVGPGGCFRFDQAPAGAYRLSLCHTVDGAQHEWYASDTLRIDSDGTHDVRIDCTPRWLFLRVLAPDGKKPAKPGTFNVWPGVRDQVGDWLRFDFYPGTPVWVTTASGERLGPFTVPEAEREKRIDVVLPR